NYTLSARSVSIEGNTIKFILDMGQDAEIPAENTATRQGDTLSGTMRMGPLSHTWEARRLSGKEVADFIARVPETYGYPFGPYGLEELPAQEKLLITSATIWTSGPQGVIEDGALVVSEGKIVYVGPSALIPRLTGEFRTIDAQGKHITPGLIDCPSHT